jgi:hypothetical protein
LVRRGDLLYSCFYLAVKNNSEIQKFRKERQIASLRLSSGRIRATRRFALTWR